MFNKEASTVKQQVKTIVFGFIPGLSEPIGLFYLIGFLKSRGHKVELVNLWKRGFEKKIAELKPEIIGYGAIYGNHRDYLRVNSELKKRHSFVSVFGGPYPTYYKELIRDKDVDVICVGEGEYALGSLVSSIENGKLTRLDIPNLIFKNKGDGSIIENQLSPLIEDLDSLPMPDRELFYNENPFAKYYGVKSFMSSRGCPYNCSYCFNHLYKKIYKNNGGYIRRHSVDRLIEEIIWVKKKYPLKMVYFCDDLFILDKGWLKEFGQKYPSKVGLKYYCTVRSNLMSDETAQMLKESGCYSVSMSIDSGDEFIRNSVFQRGITEEQIEQACYVLKKSGIKVSSNIILGGPYSSLESELKSLRLVKKCKPFSVTYSYFQPYRGLLATQKAIEGGFLNSEYYAARDSFYEDIPLKLPDKNEIKMLGVFFQLFYYFNVPEGIIKKIIKLKHRKLYSVLSAILRMFVYQKIFPYRKSLREILFNIGFLLRTNSMGVMQRRV